MAAPGSHRLLLENDAVRVLEARIGPGETVPLHTHRWPSVLYVVANAEHVRRDETGTVISDTRVEGGPAPAGSTFWLTARGPHSVENVDEAEIRLLNIELKHG